MVIRGDVLGHYGFEFSSALIRLTVVREVPINDSRVLLEEEALLDPCVEKTESIVWLCYPILQLFGEDISRPRFDVAQINVRIGQLTLEPDLDFNFGYVLLRPV